MIISAYCLHSDRSTIATERQHAAAAATNILYAEIRRQNTQEHALLLAEIFNDKTRLLVVRSPFHDMHKLEVVEMTAFEWSFFPHVFDLWQRKQNNDIISYPAALGRLMANVFFQHFECAVSPVYTFA